MMTKTEEREAINIVKEMIQKRFKTQFGFAPNKKDIRPLECCYTKVFNDVWIVESLAFHVNGHGWVYTKEGKIEKADAYNMK